MSGYLMVDILALKKYLNFKCNYHQIMFSRFVGCFRIRAFEHTMLKLERWAIFLSLHFFFQKQQTFLCFVIYDNLHSYNLGDLLQFLHVYRVVKTIN